MVANVNNMRATFIKCNNAYFEGKFRLPIFELVHSYNICACFHYSYDRWFGSKFYDPIIFASQTITTLRRRCLWI